MKLLDAAAINGAMQADNEAQPPQPTADQPGNARPVLDKAAGGEPDRPRIEATLAEATDQGEIKAWWRDADDDYVIQANTGEVTAHYAKDVQTWFS